MVKEEKKAYMLLKSVVFHYHGLDEEEHFNLIETAERLDAEKELEWANNFISKNHFTSFERARKYLSPIIGGMPKEKKIEYINMVWEANCIKGYITEMEATAIVKFAKDWDIQDELKALVKEKTSSD